MIAADAVLAAKADLLRTIDTFQREGDFKAIVQQRRALDPVSIMREIRTQTDLHTVNPHLSAELHLHFCIEITRAI